MRVSQIHRKIRPKTVHSWFTMDNTTADVVPAEIALLEMSLKNGVMRKYLQLIDPGEVPAGYKAQWFQITKTRQK